MRTTLNLDEDVLATLKRYAEDRSLPLGKAASNVMRRGFEAPVETRLVNGFHTIVLPPGPTEKITTERVKELLEDEI